jgi:hypothetical protein
VNALWLFLFSEFSEFSDCKYELGFSFLLSFLLSFLFFWGPFGGLSGGPNKQSWSPVAGGGPRCKGPAVAVDPTTTAQPGVNAPFPWASRSPHLGDPDSAACANRPPGKGREGPEGPRTNGQFGGGSCLGGIPYYGVLSTHEKQRKTLFPPASPLRQVLISPLLHPIPYFSFSQSKTPNRYSVVLNLLVPLFPVS